MGEKNVISKVSQPNTRKSLVREFEALGLERGGTVIVHSSLSSLGWVCGGPVAVIQALMDVLGQEGTLVMPTQTGDNSDPSLWENPPVPESWWETIREEMPAFDPAITPTRGMGKIVEAFRTFPQVKRSNHPSFSFAAWGKHADYILSEQPLEEGFGPRSPLAKIYELDGNVLLLGVGHDSNTSLHLAEHSIPNREIVKKSAAMFVEGKPVWKTFEGILYDSDVFEELGKKFEEEHFVKEGFIGSGKTKLISQRELIDFARDWFRSKVL
ncbi:AAC(3) family N-acetyltransferase [Bacillaceae bacterium S4-13-58]